MARAARLVFGLSLLLLASPAPAAGLFELGDVVVADRGNEAVLRYSPATGAVETITSPTVGEGPIRIFEPALGPDDALYHQYWPHLLRIDPRTGDRTVIVDAMRPIPRVPSPTVHRRDPREIYALYDDDVWRVHVDGSPAELVAEATGVGGPNRELLVGADSFRLLGLTNLPGQFVSEIVDVPFGGGPAADWAYASSEVENFAMTRDGATYVLEVEYAGFDLDSVEIHRVEEGGAAGDETLVSGPTRGTGPPFGSNDQIPRTIFAAHADTLYVTTDGNPGLMYRVDIATGDRELALSIPGSNDFGIVRGFVVWPEDVPLDLDGDGVADGFDNCPGLPNPDQADSDGDGNGDLCNPDADGDGFADGVDNCPELPNPGQEDFDGNGVGDACNAFEDPDGDEVADGLDNCPDDANPGQEDFDGNGVGDACNAFEDRDGDDIADDLDGCPDDFDPTRADGDGDGLEDACDPFPMETDHDKGQCFADLQVCTEAPKFVDEDGDGEHDPTDRCPETLPAAAVDDAGCSRAQFCGQIEIRSWLSLVECTNADWRNDELGWPDDCGVRWFGWPLACIPR